MPLSLPEQRLAHLPPSSFSPHLFPTSYSVRDFRHLQSATAEKFGCRCQFCLWLCRGLRFAFRHRLCLFFWRQIPSPCQTLSLFHLPPDLRCSLRLLLALLLSACCWLCSCLPVVGFALVTMLFCFALVVPVFGYALSVLLIFTCCWVCSSRGRRTRVASFLPLTTGSLLVVLSLIPPASLCGSLRLRGSLLASSNTTTQHCATS